MKKFCCSVFVSLFIISCSSDDPVNPESVTDLMLINIKQNSMMTDETFNRTFQILEAQGSLATMVAKFKTRESFITKMEELTKDVVGESINQVAFSGGWTTSAYQYTQPISPTTLKEFIADAGVGIEGTAPGTGVVDRYSIHVDAQLDGRQGEQILIESFSLAPPSTSQARPSEQVSYNFAEIKSVKETLESLIIQFPVDTDLDREINIYTTANKSKAILIGLLVPAIQKIREAPAATKNSYEKMNDLIFGTTTPSAERTLWNQRMKQVALLSAVDLIASGQFDNSNENFSSVSVQAEMHYGVCVLAWAKIYETHS